MKRRHSPHFYPSDQIDFGPDNVQDAPRCAGGYRHRTPPPSNPISKRFRPNSKGSGVAIPRPKTPKRDKLPPNPKGGHPPMTNPQ